MEDLHILFIRYGEVVNINLVKDKRTKKSKGFCFLAYEDQRSSVLAVDNLNGIKVSMDHSYLTWRYQVMELYFCFIYS